MKEKGFLGLTFLISWGIQLALILKNHMQDGMSNALYVVIMLTPALAVLATKYAIKEPLWEKFWLKPEGRKTVKYCIIGWLAPVVLIGIGCVVYFLFFRSQFDSAMTATVQSLRDANGGLPEFTDKEMTSTLRMQIVFNVIMAPFYNFFPSVGEEIGWRGYFLNMLCEKYPKWKAVVIDGVVWGIWYFPMVIAMGLNYGKDYVGYPVVGCLCMVVYCIVLGTLYSYLTIKTHSCIPAILANACVASMSGVGTLFMKNKDISVFFNPMPSSIIGGIGFVIVAVIILYQLAKGKVEPVPAKEEIVVVSDRTGKTGDSLKSHLDKLEGYHAGDRKKK